MLSADNNNNDGTAISKSGGQTPPKTFRELYATPSRKMFSAEAGNNGNYSTIKECLVRNPQMIVDDDFFAIQALRDSGKAKWLMSRLTAEERAEIESKEKDCVKEAVLTRQVPIFMATLAAFYALKPKGLAERARLIRYGVLIFGSLALLCVPINHMLFKGHSRVRLGDRYRELYDQHQEHEANSELGKSLDASSESGIPMRGNRQRNAK